MSDVKPMAKPWSVVGAGFNDEGVYFTFDDAVIHRDDINLMQAAPELLEALQRLISDYDRYKSVTVVAGIHDEPQQIQDARAAIAKALGESK